MLGNTSTAWGGPARLSHAVSAVLAVFLPGYGAWMTHFAPRGARVSLCAPPTIVAGRAVMAAVHMRRRDAAILRGMGR